LRVAIRVRGKPASTNFLAKDAGSEAQLIRTIQADGKLVAIDGRWNNRKHAPALAQAGRGGRG